MSVATPVEGAVQSVYKSVTKGYDYTQGYHFLMKHMSRRCVRPRIGVPLRAGDAGRCAQ